MFCSNCGKEIREGALFCMNCGTPVKKPAVEEPVVEQPAEAAPAKEEPVVEAPVVEQPVVEAPVVEAPVVEQPVEEAPVVEAPVAPVPPTMYADPAPVPPKKKKGFLKWLIPLVAVIAAIAVVIAFFGSGIKGLFLKTFGADEDYYAFVEEKALEEGTEAISSVYGVYLNAYQGMLTGDVAEQKSTASITLNLGDKVMDLLSENLPDGVDLSWIDGAAFNVTANVKDNKVQALVGVKVGKSEQFDVEAIIDMENGDVYLGLPASDKEYFKFEGLLEEAFAEMEGLIGDEELQALLKALPTDKELNALLNRYVKVVFGSLEKGDVEMSSTTLDVGDVSQKCTQIDVKITPALVMRVVKNVLTEAKEDKDIEKYVTRVYNALAETDLLEDAPFDDAEELYEELVDGIDDVIDDIDDEDVDEDEELAVLTVYVDGSHGVIGREVTVDDESLFFVANAEKSGKVATKIAVMGDMLVLEGGGTKKGNLVSATYEVKKGEQALLTLELKDFNEKKAEDGYLSGTMILTPSADLLDLIVGEGGMGTMLETATPALEMIFNTTEKKAEVTVNLLIGGEMYVGLAMTDEIGTATDITLPEATVDGEDEDALTTWLGDAEDPIALMEELGVPTEIVDLVETVMGSASNGDNLVDTPDDGWSDDSDDGWSDDSDDGWSDDSYDGWSDDSYDGWSDDSNADTTVEWENGGAVVEVPEYEFY